jgi:hypothetical protein
MTTTSSEKPARSFTGQQCRLLLRRVKTASLATLNRDDGGPYVSVVNVATDPQGRPLIFISKLAWHTKNILGDPRASLLAAELPTTGDVLTGARVTVMGRLKQVPAAEIQHRYLACHPEAEGYIAFADFAFWRLMPERVHAVAGFGRIETLAADEVFLDLPGWPALEQEAIRHMKEDHGDQAALYAARLGGAPEGDWRIAAIDPDGCDLVGENTVLRVSFDAPASDGNGLRLAFKALSQKARQ